MNSVSLSELGRILVYAILMWNSMSQTAKARSDFRPQIRRWNILLGPCMSITNRQTVIGERSNGVRNKNLNTPWRSVEDILVTNCRGHLGL